MRLRIQPRFCLILIAAMVVVFAVSMCLSAYDLHIGSRRLTQVEAEFEVLNNQLVELREELAFAQTDEYVERVARDELGMLMPGEIRYVSGN